MSGIIKKQMFSPRFIFCFGLIQKHRINRFLLREVSRTSDWAFPARSGFTTFCHQKVAPKVSAGHLRRDRTAVLPKRARKIYAVCAHPLRALEPLFDLFPPPVQCGGCCALRATMIICWCLFLAVLWPARMHCFRYFRSAIRQAGGLLNRV